MIAKQIRFSAVFWLGLLCTMLAPTIVSAAPGAPQFTSPATTNFTLGVFNTFTVTVTGTPTPSIFLHGKLHKLPAGITFKDNNDGTGTLSGTPRPGTGGNRTVRFHAQNSVNPAATQNFVIVINQAPAFTSGSAATCAIGVACTFTVSAAGFPAPSIDRTGPALPMGMNYVDNHNGTGTLSGTPAAGATGVYPFTFTAHNTAGADAVQNFTLTVNQFLIFTSIANKTCVVGTFCTFSVTAAGQPLPTLTHSTGVLPAGMTFTPNGAGSATLSGTPLALSGGVYHPIWTAHNSVEPDAVQSFTLTVNEAPKITSVPSLVCAVGSFCTLDVTTSGYPLPALAQTGGSFPAAVTYSDNGDGTGTFDGIPNPGTNGVYHPVFTASNGIGVNALQNFTLTVNLSLAITSDNFVECLVGSPCTFTVTAAGMPTSIVQTGDTLPMVLTFVDNHNGSATLSGTPAVGTGNVYNLIITAANGVETNVVQNFTLTVDEAPSITSATSKTCLIGVACTFTVTAIGYPLPGISRTPGPLASGIEFIDNLNGTGTLSGTANPGSGGIYNLLFTASNGIGTDGTQNFTLTVHSVPLLTVVINGSGTGTVGSAPAGIACPGDCSEAYEEGTMVMLTATPTGGSVFTGWIGGGCGLTPSCAITMSVPTTLSATFSAAPIVRALDIDDSFPGTTYDPMTDGLLVVRYMFGFTGTFLTADAVGGTANRTLPQIPIYLDDIRPLLDIDGDGKIDALTDGLLIIRHLFGLTGAALVNGAVASGATRSTSDIETYLSTLTP